MKKYIILAGLIIVALAILLPFASTTPDGLETMVEASEAQEPVWGGLIGDYTIAAISNPYLSTLAAGIFGTAVVFLFTFLLSAKISPKKRANQ